MSALMAFAPGGNTVEIEQQKKDARLRSMIFSLVAQSSSVSDPDKALAKSKVIYAWIKEGK